jgi:SM-20-related protein
MPSPKFLQAAGIFLLDGFLAPEQCDAIREEMATSQQAQAALFQDGVPGAVVNPSTRKTSRAKISKASKLKVHDALAGLLPALSAHFKVTLKGIEPTNYLVYREGDFFKLHSDVSRTLDRQEARRKVSLVVFLNDQSGPPGDGGYEGGSLVFYGLQPPPFEKLGHPLVGKRGTLVAFRPDLLHEVQPVTRGTRYTVVSWCE